MFGGGYAIIAGLISMSKEELEKKCSSLGYRLYKHKISWRAAYWDCLFTIIKWPFVLTGGAVALAGYSGGHIWETLIVGIIITIPPTIAQIKPFLIKSELEAETNYKDD